MLSTVDGHDVFYIQMYKNLNRDRSRISVYILGYFVNVFVLKKMLCELTFILAKRARFFSHLVKDGAGSKKKIEKLSKKRRK